MHSTKLNLFLFMLSCNYVSKFGSSVEMFLSFRSVTSDSGCKSFRLFTCELLSLLIQRFVWRYTGMYVIFCLK
jgi:hypothetical protein